jgi:hypothetical protein
MMSAAAFTRSSRIISSRGSFLTILLKVEKCETEHSHL